MSYICVVKANMFSKTCEYALKAMIFVAQKSGENGRVGIKEIAQGTDVTFYCENYARTKQKKADTVHEGPQWGILFF